MRDLGTLVWVVLVFVGVVSSMISTIRKQAQRSPGRPQQPRPAVVVRYAGAPRPTAPPQPTAGQAVPPPVAPPPVASPPAARPEPRTPAHPTEEPRRKRMPLFAGAGQLVRAVIAAEVLGKPRGLSDEHFPR